MKKLNQVTKAGKKIFGCISTKEDNCSFVFNKIVIDDGRKKCIIERVELLTLNMRCD